MNEFYISKYKHLYTRWPRKAKTKGVIIKNPFNDQNNFKNKFLKIRRYFNVKVWTRYINQSLGINKP